MSDMQVSDIHSYTIFANIDRRNGIIEGHQLILSDVQLEMIEAIIVSSKQRLKAREVASYTIGDDDEE